MLFHLHYLYQYHQFFQTEHQQNYAIPVGKGFFRRTEQLTPSYTDKLHKSPKSAVWMHQHRDNDM